MLEHYGLTESQWRLLKRAGVEVSDLFYAVSDFQAENAPLSKVSLLHYADRHGDFLEGKSKTDLLAQKVFENLSIPDQVEVGDYLEYLESEKC